MEARMENFSTWIDYSNDLGHKDEIEKLLIAAGFSILNYMEHPFEPQGFTAIWLLAESHCAVHTFPEERKTYVELTSCNVAMYAKFIQLFHQKYHEIH
ncbi:MAG: S-adenosylmethionine decarboxylase [Ekhidna sp.]|nr:S-adenosylmethionine decarboxylase [Ekhidna sp.]